MLQKGGAYTFTESLVDKTGKAWYGKNALAYLVLVLEV
jgi:hypothetical protein